MLESEIVQTRHDPNVIIVVASSFGTGVEIQQHAEGRRTSRTSTVVVIIVIIVVVVKEGEGGSVPRDAVTISERRQSVLQ